MTGVIQAAGGHLRSRRSETAAVCRRRWYAAAAMRLGNPDVLPVGRSSPFERKIDLGTGRVVTLAVPSRADEEIG